MKYYVRGKEYKDQGNPKDLKDQFTRLLRSENKGISTSGGIRSWGFSNIDPRDLNSNQKIPAVLVLLTTEIETEARRPWKDLVNRKEKKITYHGDAKHDRDRTYTDFRGCKALIATNSVVTWKKKKLIPPILHFTKSRKGYIEFTGLCTMEALHTEAFKDGDFPVTNLITKLNILDEDKISLEWLKARAECKESPFESDLLAPEEWIKKR